MHKPWINDFEAFRSYMLEHLGPRPSDAYSIDRLDNDGHYEPGNLRWATRKEQARNRSTTKLDDWDVRFIRYWCQAGFGQRSIAEAFGICRPYVSQLNTGYRRAL